MIVEILQIEECPGWECAAARVRDAVALLGRTDLKVAARLLRSTAEAAASVFAGSPTITVNGVDIFPSDGRTDALACRVYATPQGLAGAPTHEQIVEALRARI